MMEVDPESGSQMGPMTELVLSLGKTTAQIVAQFSPVPGVYPAVLFLVAIIETCEGVIYNRQAACTLFSVKYFALIHPPEMRLGVSAIDATILLSHSTMYVRLHQTVLFTPWSTTLWGEYHHISKELIVPDVVLLHGFSYMRQIQTRMDGWANVSKFKGFTHQKAIAEEIQECGALLDECLTKFNVSTHVTYQLGRPVCRPIDPYIYSKKLASQLQIHGWQAEFAASMKHDHLELMESMSDIKIIQQTTNSKLDENNEMVRQMMKMMQEV